MKFIFILLTITLASAFDSPIDKLPPSLTLNEWYEMGQSEMANVQNMMKLFGQPHSVYDYDCAKEKLKLTQNGAKTVKRELAFPMVLLLLDICTVSGTNKWETVTNFLSEVVEHSTNAENLDCFKKALKEIDPSSEVVKDFNANVDEEICKAKVEDPKFVEYLRTMLSDIDVDEYTCGTVSMKELQTVGYRMPILKFGNVSDEVKKTELKHATDLILNLQRKAFNCHVEKVDKL